MSYRLSRMNVVPLHRPSWNPYANSGPIFKILPCLRHRSAKLATGCVWKSTAVLPCSSAPDHERDCRSTAAVIYPAVLPPAILFATATFVLSVLSLRRAMDRPPALLSHPRRLHRPLQTMARIRISRRGSGTRLPLVCGWPLDHNVLYVNNNIA